MKIVSQSKNTAQDIQDEIFKRMTAEQKIKAASSITSLCLKLNQLNNERNGKKSRTTSY